MVDLHLFVKSKSNFESKAGQYQTLLWHLLKLAWGYISVSNGNIIIYMFCSLISFLLLLASKFLLSQQVVGNCGKIKKTSTAAKKLCSGIHEVYF